MALPTSGQAISLSQVNTELGNSSTAQISLNDAAVRSLFGKASGAISMSDGHGKSAAFAASITTNQVEMNLRTFAVNAGWNQSSIATITLNSSVYVSSNANGTAAMTINGSWPGGVTLVNNGFIMGRGGNGARLNPQVTSQSGGTAISLGVNCSITNNSGAFIGGGGGGGGALTGGGGGGAGGGAGGAGNPGEPFNPGGAGGGVGQPGANAPILGSFSSSNGGGGGGRIFPGTGGAGGGPTFPQRNGKGGGAGGGGGAYFEKYTILGGAGGSGGSSGSNGTPPGGPTAGAGGGGGGWGATGGAASLIFNPSIQFIRAGAAGGKAIALNGYTATRTGAGTTFGAVS